MGYLSTDKKKITTKTFAEMKAAGEKVTMLTAYDFTTAGIIDAAGIDTILIGDSASNVMAGNADTLPITVDQMIYHARSVARACNHALRGLRYAFRQLSDLQGRGLAQCLPNDEGDGRGCAEARRWRGDSGYCSRH